MFRNKEYEKLNQMLDDAIEGNFSEDSFDETELSRLQSKLMRYLSAASMSERQITEEKEKLNELITNISHQTRTPLSNILLYSELLCESEIGEEYRKYAEEIHSQSKKLEGLVNSLVRMARLESGFFQFRRQKKRLFDAVSRAVEQILPKAGEKDIEIVAENDSDPESVYDLKWVVEALFNVLDNAVKYSPSGTTVTVRTFHYEMFSGIAVTDQGQGIPQDETAQIFRRFYRGRDVHDREGAGVGLFLTRQIVEEHGGYVVVRSEHGKGSTFELFFPNETRL